MRPDDTTKRAGPAITWWLPSGRSPATQTAASDRTMSPVETSATGRRGTARGVCE